MLRAELPSVQMNYRTISVTALLSVLSISYVTLEDLSELLYQWEWEFSKSLNVLFSEVTSDSLSHRTLMNELFAPVT